MDIDTPSACQEFQLLQPLGLLRGGGGGGLDNEQSFLRVCIFIQSISDQSSVLLFNQEVLGERTARTTTASRKTAI